MQATHQLLILGPHPNRERKNLLRHVHKPRTLNQSLQLWPGTAFAPGDNGGLNHEVVPFRERHVLLERVVDAVVFEVEVLKFDPAAGFGISILL